MKKIRQHWTPRYIYSRALQLLYYHTHSHEPWLTRQAIRLLKNLLESDHVGFEWGSGRSTTWYAQRTSEITSIEHNRDWYDEVRKMTADSNIKGAHVEFHPLDGLELSSAEVEHTSYVQSITRFEPETFDYVIVDGRIRHFCALIALEYIKSKGVLVLDNADRYIAYPKTVISPNTLKRGSVSENEYWERFEMLTHDWERIWTCDGVSATTLFFKP